MDVVPDIPAHTYGLFFVNESENTPDFVYCSTNRLPAAEPKFRRLRMNNAKVHAALVDTDGALEIMQHVGFVLEFESVDGQEEGYLVCPQHTELDTMHEAVDALSTLLPGHAPRCEMTLNCFHVLLCTYAPPPHRPPPQPRGPITRNTRVLMPVETEASVPDWFFDYTSAELKARYTEAVQARERSQTLMTAAMREKLQGTRIDPSTFTHALIRVRLPEGLVLQGEFAPGETTADVYSWVTEALRRQDLPFDLVLPMRTRLEGGACAAAMPMHDAVCRICVAPLLHRSRDHAKRGFDAEYAAKFSLG